MVRHFQNNANNLNTICHRPRGRDMHAVRRMVNTESKDLTKKKKKKKTETQKKKKKRFKKKYPLDFLRLVHFS